MVIAELKTQDAATAATVRIASLPAASQVGMTAGPESGIVGNHLVLLVGAYYPNR